MTRIDRVEVVITGYVEFEGDFHIRMDWNPEPDDPLVPLLLERHHQTVLTSAGEIKEIL